MLDLKIEMLKLETFPEKYPYGYSQGAFNEGIGIDEYNKMMNDTYNIKGF